MQTDEQRIANIRDFHQTCPPESCDQRWLLDRLEEAQRRVGELEQIIDDALALDRGEQVMRPQPHHPLLSVMAGNKKSLEALGAELARVPNEPIDEEVKRAW